MYLSYIYFQHGHYFDSTYDKSYNYSPYEVPKELKHLKGMYQVV